MINETISGLQKNPIKPRISSIETVCDTVCYLLYNTVLELDPKARHALSKDITGKPRQTTQFEILKVSSTSPPSKTLKKEAV